MLYAILLRLYDFFLFCSLFLLLFIFSKISTISTFCIFISETAAKVIDYGDVVDINQAVTGTSDLRKKNLPALGDLDNKYAGKRTSRKDLEDIDLGLPDGETSFITKALLLEAKKHVFLTSQSLSHRKISLDFKVWFEVHLLCLLWIIMTIMYIRMLKGCQ